MIELHSDTATMMRIIINRYDLPWRSLVGLLLKFKKLNKECYLSREENAGNVTRTEVLLRFCL